MYIPSSVRGAALGLMLLALSSFSSSNTILEGKWACSLQTGSLDANSTFELKCAGSLQFKPNHLLVSNCQDGFFPDGARWELVNGQLLLRDSDEKVFAEFKVLQLDQTSLQLERRNVIYRFTRVD